MNIEDLEKIPLTTYIWLVKKTENYVRNFQLKYALTKYPEIRRMAQSLNLPQAVVLQLCEDSEILMVNVGLQIPQMGYAVYDNIGDYQVEDMTDEIWEEYERRIR